MLPSIPAPHVAIVPLHINAQASQYASPQKQAFLDAFHAARTVHPEVQALQLAHIHARKMGGQGLGGIGQRMAGMGPKVATLPMPQSFTGSPGGY